MSKSKKNDKGLADPSRLAPTNGNDDETFQVVIETPKGSRNKYAFDQDARVFALKKVLPAGMTFPHDFGFVPSTKAEDGDPIDVLVLMDEPAFPGVLLKCRPIGVIEEGEQGKRGDKERNDRNCGHRREQSPMGAREAYRRSGEAVCEGAGGFFRELSRTERQEVQGDRRERAGGSQAADQRLSAEGERKEW